MTTRSGRIASIDLLRGWAVIVMIETHMVNATIRPDIAAGAFFPWLTFLNGLVAPSFLFASGLAYAVTTRRKVHEYLSFGPPLFRQIQRLLLILAVGYILHLPHFSYARMARGVTEADWARFFQADVLQCIAVSLLFLQLLLLVARSERVMYRVLAVLTPLILLVTPLLWTESVAAALPAPVAAYLNGLGKSLFPLFPWSVFLFSGAITGYLFVRMRETPEGEGRFFRALPFAGAALIVAGLISGPLAATLYPVYDHWRFGPPFVLLRIGIVILLLAGMFLFERSRGVGARSPVTLLGRESLLVYGAHLMLIYGDFGPFNFRKTVDHAFGYGAALSATAVLLALMYAGALGWETVKRDSPRWKTAIIAGFVTILVAVFFLTPA